MTHRYLATFADRHQCPQNQYNGALLFILSCILNGHVVNRRKIPLLRSLQFRYSVCKINCRLAELVGDCFIRFARLKNASEMLIILVAIRMSFSALTDVVFTYRAIRELN